MFKSIQSGVAGIGLTQDTISVSLNFPVKVDKSFIRIEVDNLAGQSSVSTLAGDYLFAPELDTIVSGEYTKFTLRRWYLTPGGIQMWVKWTVFEMVNGSVESGVTNITSTDQSVVIGNYVDGKTFSSAYLWGDFGSWGGDFSAQVIQSRVYNNGANDVIRFRGLNTSTVKIYWQSIYNPDFDVQMEVVSLPTGQTYDHTFSSAVDLDKTLLMHSFYQSTASHDAWHLKGGRMLSTTQIRYFSQASFDGEAVSYVIQCPCLNLVERGFTSWSTQNVSFALSSPVNKDRGFVNMPLQNGHWGLVDFAAEWFGDIGHESSFQNLIGDSYTNLRFDRGSTSGTSVITYWEVFELSLGDTIGEYRRVTKGMVPGMVPGM
jgi:hypothetical protein